MEIREYFKYQIEQEKKFGNRTVVLMQVGTFYEIYELDPESCDKNELANAPIIDGEKITFGKIGKATELSSILNMVLTKKDKSKPHSITNPKMIGFPCASFEKNADVLLANNYIIAKVDQVISNKNELSKNKIRKLSEVISPGSDIGNIGNLPTTNQIASIYIEAQKKPKSLDDMIITSGVSTIDVSTGSSSVCEFYSTFEDNLYAVHEIYRFLKSQQPREILIFISGIDTSREQEFENYLMSKLDLHKHPLVSIKFNQINKEYIKLDYQQQFFSKIFNTSLLMKCNIIEELNLERTNYGRLSYIMLLKYCYDHNEHILKKIQIPEVNWSNNNKNLTLTHNAIYQLNILSLNKTSKKIDSLLSVLDNCSTALGKRFLKNILLNPLTDVDTLEKYYNTIDELINSSLLKSINDNLDGLPDIERYQRKVQLQLIQPHELVILSKSYDQIIGLHNIIKNSNTYNLKNLLPEQKYIEELENYVKEFNTKYDSEKMELCKIVDNKIENRGSFIKKDSEIKEYSDVIDNYYTQLEEICLHLNILIGKTKGNPISLKDKSKSKKKNDIGMKYFIQTTPTKANILKKLYSKINTDMCGQISFTAKSGKMLIISDKIDDICKNLEKAIGDFEHHLYNYYKKMINNIIEMYNFFGSINKFIATLDYFSNLANIAKKYKYFRPTIDRSQNKSFIKGEDLRHPIIERIIDHEYIVNDLSLGKYTDNSPYGVLLYGVNSTGKSSLTKLIGLNLIMAQMGGFTAGKICYYPYSQIITRLSGEDDILNGKSSFIVEMSELRTILRNANESTLVLGDELTRGTETISGTALTIATVMTLLKKKVSFIFSTHMHHLVDTDYIKKINVNDLKICHLTTTYDEENDVLIYDRKLKDGVGPSIYGLEVAKSLRLGEEFISLANEIRKCVSGVNKEILSTKKSRYSPRLYVDECSLCKSKINLETHHINHQSEADDDGFIDHFHKNSKFNLIILCDNCHTELHRNKLKIIKHDTLEGELIKLECA